MAILNIIHKIKALEELLQFKERAYATSQPPLAQTLQNMTALLQGARIAIERDIRDEIAPQLQGIEKPGIATPPLSGNIFLLPLEKAQRMADEQELLSLDPQLRSLTAEIGALQQQLKAYALRRPIELKHLLEDKLAATAFMLEAMNER